LTRLRSAEVLGQVERFHDLAVGHSEHLAVAGPQLGDPQRDVLDRAYRVIVGGDRQLDQIAEAVLLLGDDEESAQEVLDDALRSETEGSTEDGSRGHQRADGQTERVDDVDGHHDVQDGDGHRGDHRCDRLTVFDRLALHGRIHIVTCG
jgi:hypothetical protein